MSTRDVPFAPDPSPAGARAQAGTSGVRRREGLQLLATNAGIGGDTSEMILTRWDEVDRRRGATAGTAVIAEFGVNDVMEHEGALRVDEAGTVAALRGMIDRAPEGRFLVVGPPPVVWDEVNDLSDSIARGYVSVSDLRDVLKREYDIEI